MASKRRKSRKKSRKGKSRRKSRKPKKTSGKTGKTIVYLKKSNKKEKKWMVYIVNPKGGGKTIHFGARGMSDYTKHKDKNRMKRYSNRHNRKETWSKAGIRTAGFWSKNLLWNKPSFTASKRDIARRFGITFRSGWPKK